MTSTSVPGSTSIVDIKPAEQPYVVMFSAAHILSAAGGRLGSEKIQECWGFEHPRPDVVTDDQGKFQVPIFAGEKKQSTDFFYGSFSFSLLGLPLTNHHNARSTHLTFHIPRAGVCHGFAGYFEAVLYGDIGLSIHPERAAGDMLSWFPIFFPLLVSHFFFFHSVKL